MAGKGGGAWKVAYADFTTAMMAFFMVLWITTQSTEVKEAVAQHFTNPFGTFKTGGALRPPLPKPNYQEDLSVHPNIEPDPSVDRHARRSTKPYLLRLNNGDRTIVGTVVLFAERSEELDEAAKKELLGLIPALAGKPHKIEIRGHASRRPPPPGSPFRDAWGLCYARCVKTMEFLRQQGIKQERMRLSQAGAYEPLVLPRDPRPLDLESRVEVFMLSELAHDALATQVEHMLPPEPAQAASPEAPANRHDAAPGIGGG